MSNSKNNHQNDSSALRSNCIPDTKLQLQPGMSKSTALAQIKEHGYVGPSQFYPSSDGGNISVYINRNPDKKHLALIVEWAGPLQHQSVRKYVEVNAPKQKNESIPWKEVFEMLQRNENKGDKRERHSGQVPFFPVNIPPTYVTIFPYHKCKENNQDRSRKGTRPL